MPQAELVSSTRRNLLSRTAALSAAGALAACVPNMAAAAELGANPELVRLIAEARTARDEENRLWDKADGPDMATHIAREDYYQPQIVACSDRRWSALEDAGHIPLRTPADVRFAAQAVLGFSTVRDPDGCFSYENFSAELGGLVLSVIEAAAGVPHDTGTDFRW